MPIYLKKKQYKERHANLTEAQLIEKEEEIKNTEIELKIIKNNGLKRIFRRTNKEKQN